jgi:hypothetical protein
MSRVTIASRPAGATASNVWDGRSVLVVLGGGSNAGGNQPVDTAAAARPAERHVNHDSHRAGIEQHPSTSSEHHQAEGVCRSAATTSRPPRDRLQSVRQRSSSSGQAHAQRLPPCVAPTGLNRRISTGTLSGHAPGSTWKNATAPRLHAARPRRVRPRPRRPSQLLRPPKGVREHGHHTRHRTAGRRSDSRARRSRRVAATGRRRPTDPTADSGDRRSAEVAVPP